MNPWDAWADIEQDENYTTAPDEGKAYIRQKYWDEKISPTPEFQSLDVPDAEKNSMKEWFLNGRKHPEPSNLDRPIIPSSADYSKPEELPESRFGIVGDIGSGLASGVLTSGEMAARAARAFDPPGGTDIVRNAATSVIDATEGIREEYPRIFKPSKQTMESGLRSAVYGGFEAIPASVGVPLGIAAATASLPAWGTAAAVGLGAGLIFGASEFDQYMDDAQKAGKSYEESLPYALASGAVEGGFEGLTDVVGAKLFGLTGNSLNGFKSTVKGMLTRNAGRFIKDLGKQSLVEIPTEMIQAGGETLIRNIQGVSDDDPMKQALNAIGPAAVMTVVFGASGHYMGGRQRKAIEQALTGDNINPETRQKAIDIVAENIKLKDPAIAEQWQKQATSYVQNGNQPVPIDVEVSDWITKNTKDVQPQPEGLDEINKNLEQERFAPIAQAVSTGELPLKDLRGMIQAAPDEATKAGLQNIYNAEIERVAQARDKKEGIVPEPIVTTTPVSEVQNLGDMDASVGGVERITIDGTLSPQAQSYLQDQETKAQLDRFTKLPGQGQVIEPQAEGEITGTVSPGDEFDNMAPIYNRKTMPKAPSYIDELSAIQEAERNGADPGEIQAMKASFRNRNGLDPDVMPYDLVQLAKQAKDQGLPAIKRELNDEDLKQGTEESAPQGRTEDQGSIEGTGTEPVKAGTEAETNADVGLDRSVQGEVTPDNGKKEPELVSKTDELKPGTPAAPTQEAIQDFGMSDKEQSALERMKKDKNLSEVKIAPIKLATGRDGYQIQFVTNDNKVVKGASNREVEPLKKMVRSFLYNRANPNDAKSLPWIDLVDETKVTQHNTDIESQAKLKKEHNKEKYIRDRFNKTNNDLSKLEDRIKEGLFVREGELEKAQKAFDNAAKNMKELDAKNLKATPPVKTDKVAPAEAAQTPTPDIYAPSGKPFRTTKAALAGIKKQGKTLDDYEVVSIGKGQHVGRKKAEATPDNGKKEPWEMSKDEFGVPSKPVDTEIHRYPRLEKIANDSPEKLTEGGKAILAEQKEAKKKHAKYLKDYRKYVDKANAHFLAVRDAVVSGKLTPERYTELHEKDYGPLEKFAPELVNKTDKLEESTPTDKGSLTVETPVEGEKAEITPNRIAERYVAIAESAGKHMSFAVAMKNARALMDAMRNKTFTELLLPNNRVSRTIYEEFTEEKLPKTHKAIREYFEKVSEIPPVAENATTESVNAKPKHLTSIGRAWVNGQWKPITESKPITKGKNKGKYNVTLGTGRHKIVDTVKLDEVVEKEAVSTEPTKISVPTIEPIPETPTPVKESKPGEVQDFGEKLGGAKKDRQVSINKDLTEDDIREQPLSKLWPKAEVDSIEDTWVAAVATTLRNSIPNKPKTGYKLNRWVESINKIRDLMVNAEQAGRERFETMAKERGLHDTIAKINLLGQIDRKHWDRIGLVSERPDAYTFLKEGGEVPSPFVSVIVDGRYQSFHGKKSVNEIIDELNVKLEGTKKPTSTMKFEVRGSNGKYFINKKGDPLYRKLKTFEDTKTAFAYIKDNYDSLLSAWETVKETDNVKETDVRRKENRVRSGKDHRKGKDATPDMFLDTFGFRGVEFGNWVSQGKNTKERQGMLNAAYDALMDLSNIIGTPPKAISLNGALGLGLGSRGSGWASAHYEPWDIVINLTKTRGAGSLAHEWFHALDNYFQIQRYEKVSDKDDAFITFQPEIQYTDGKFNLSEKRYKELKERGALHKPDEWHKIEDKIRPEVSEAFVDLVQALDASPMAKRSKLLDKGGSKKYWGNIIERSARSFENYIIAKMQQDGYHNDYLANVVSINEFTRDNGRYPYLLTEELAPISEAFDNLFSTVKTKETDKGIALFSASNIDQAPASHLTKRAVEAIANRITRTWKNVGAIEVVQSQDELPDVVWSSGNFNRNTSIIRGVFISGWKSDRRIILVADNIADRKQLTDTILEETLGHDGIRQTLGKDYDTFLDDVYNEYSAGIEPVAKKYKLDTKQRDKRIEATDEWLAKQIAEDTLPARIWARIVRLFRQFLRKIDPTVGYTVNEIKDLARRSIKQGVKENQGQGLGVNEFAVSSRFSIDKAMKSIRDNPKFRKWFGDSKVVNEDGEPLVVYHGSTTFFTEFDSLKKGRTTDTGWFSSGFYLTPDSNIANQYANAGQPQVYPLYASIKNPYDWRANEGKSLRGIGGEKASLDKTKELMGKGYDGVFVYTDVIKSDKQISDNLWAEIQKDLPPFATKKMLETTLKRGVPYHDILNAYGKKVADSLPKERTLTEVVAFSPTQIKSIYNTGEFNPADPDIRRLYAGEKAKGAPTSNLAKAQDMEAQGKDEEEIWGDTGWTRDPSGKWMFRIDDSEAFAVPHRLPMEGKVHLDDVLFYPELYEAYEGAKYINVENHQFNDYNKKKTTLGGYSHSKNTILVDVAKINQDIKDKGLNEEQRWREIFLHEIQHAIQDAEGFASGSMGKFVTKKEIGLHSSINRLFPGPKTWRYIKEYEDELKKELKKAGYKEPVSRAKFVKNLGLPVYSKLKKAQKEEIDKSYNAYAIPMHEMYYTIKDKVTYNIYNRHAGEIYARESGAQFEGVPGTMEGIPRKDWIVTDGDGTSFSVEMPDGKEDQPTIRFSGDIKTTSKTDRDARSEELLRKYLGKDYDKPAGKKKVEAEKKRFEDIQTETTKEVAEKGSYKYIKAKKDSSLVNRTIQSPEFYFNEHVATKEVLNAALDRKDVFSIHFNDMNEFEGKDRAKLLNKYRKQDKQGYKKLMNLLVNADIDQVKHTPESLKKAGYSDRFIDTWQAFRDIMDKGFGKMIAEMQAMVDKAEAEGKSIPTVITRDDKGEKIRISLKRAIAEMGKMKGWYFPRQRDDGKYMMLATKEGKPDILKFFDYKTPERLRGKGVSLPFKMERESKNLQKQGYTVTVKPSASLSEDVFELAGKTIGIQSIINQGLDKISAGEQTLEDFGYTVDADTYVPKSKDVYKDESIEVRGIFYSGAYSNPEMLEKIKKGAEIILKREKGNKHDKNAIGVYIKGEKKRYGYIPKEDAGNLAYLMDNGAQYISAIKGIKGKESEPKIIISLSTQPVDGLKTFETAPKDDRFVVKGNYNKKLNDIFKSNGARYYGEGFNEGWHITSKQEKAILKDLSRFPEYATDIQALFASDLAMAVADIYKGRGALRSRIKRKEGTGKQVTRGYETDPLLVAVRYMTGIAAGMAKHDMAVRMTKAVMGRQEEWDHEKYPDFKDYKKNVMDRDKIDPALQKNLFSDTMVYMKEQLRNEESSDRVINKIKGLTVLKYLGFRPAAPLVNMTSLVTSVPAAMHGYANVPYHKVLPSMGKALIQYLQYRKGNTKSMDKDLAKLFDTIHQKGWATPQFNQEALAFLQTTHSRWLNRFINWSMVGFGVTEHINRVATIAGAFIGQKESQGKKFNYDNAVEAAKHASDRAHGQYGDSTLPILAQGQHLAAQTAKCFYVFSKFQHTYLQTMYELGFKKDKKADALYMAFAPAILFGAGASIGAKAVMAAIGKIVGSDDPEEDFYEWVGDTMGEEASMYARYGLPGMTGISLKGSLAMDPDLPTKILDLAGAPGSLISDVYEGSTNILKGNVYKGVEKMVPSAAASIMKGVREYDEGVTLSNNAPVFYGNERLRPSMAETAWRVLSFNPSRIAGIREQQWKEFKVEQDYNEAKKNIYDRYRAYLSQPQEDRTDEAFLDTGLLEDIAVFNHRLITKGMVGRVSPITFDSIKAMLRRSFRPSKKERLRKIN